MNLEHQTEDDPFSRWEREGEQVREEFKRVLASSGSSQSAVAKVINLAPATISEWVHGKYKGNDGMVTDRVKRWLSTRRPRSASSLNDGLQLPDWIATETFLAIRHALNTAHDKPAIVLVHGGSGVGKTTAINAHRFEREGVYVITSSPATGSLGGTLRALASIVPQPYGVPAAPLSLGHADALARWLRSALDGKCLIVIDEAQHLQDRALEELRLLHDDTGVGLFLAGNDVVYKNIWNRSVAAVFAPLRGRIALRIPVDKPTRDDVRAILCHPSIDLKGARELAVGHHIACISGQGLRGLLNTIAQARLQVADSETPITAELLDQVHQQMAGQLPA